MLLHYVMTFIMIKTYAAIVQTERSGHALSLYTASSILSSHKQVLKKKVLYPYFLHSSPRIKHFATELRLVSYF